MNAVGIVAHATFGRYYQAQLPLGHCDWCSATGVTLASWRIHEKDNESCLLANRICAQGLRIEDLNLPVSDVDYFDQAPFAFNGTIGTTKITYAKH